MDGVPYPFAIAHLNRLMTSEATHIIAFVKHTWGGAAKTLAYAQVRRKRGELTVTNLADGE